MNEEKKTNVVTVCEPKRTMENSIDLTDVDDATVSPVYEEIVVKSEPIDMFAEPTYGIIIHDL